VKKLDCVVACNTKNNMKRRVLMCVFMYMSYNKIKIEIDTNNELLRIHLLGKLLCKAIGEPIFLYLRRGNDRGREKGTVMEGSKPLLLQCCP
jgi:hypothetical protein